jgi:uncharacterized phiE125 gp8 family phage protein
MATAPPEPLTLAEVKEYLRIPAADTVEDSKVAAMIPRARLWVEEHTGVALVQREFAELVTPRSGVVRLSREPLIAVGSVDYTDGGGVAGVFVPTATPPSTKLTGSWPSTNGTPFAVKYTAGLAAGTEDPRLLGAMLALIDGEYTAGFAYPPEAVTAAVNCTFYMKFVAP